MLGDSTSDTKCPSPGPEGSKEPQREQPQQSQPHPPLKPRSPCVRPLEVGLLILLSHCAACVRFCFWWLYLSHSLQRETEIHLQLARFVRVTFRFSHHNLSDLLLFEKQTRSPIPVAGMLFDAWLTCLNPPLSGSCVHVLPVLKCSCGRFFLVFRLCRMFWRLTACKGSSSSSLEHAVLVSKREVFKTLPCVNLWDRKQLEVMRTIFDLKFSHKGRQTLSSYFSKEQSRRNGSAAAERQSSTVFLSIACTVLSALGSVRLFSAAMINWSFLQTKLQWLHVQFAFKGKKTIKHPTCQCRICFISFIFTTDWRRHRVAWVCSRVRSV